jgi:hypothetical protein
VLIYPVLPDVSPVLTDIDVEVAEDKFRELYLCGRDSVPAKSEKNWYGKDVLCNKSVPDCIIGPQKLLTKVVLTCGQAEVRG